MFDNLIRAWFKRHGITHPDNTLIETFEEAMLAEIKISDWIEKQDRQFLHKVLDRAAEKMKVKTRPAKAAAPATGQLPLPKTGGN